MTMINNIEWTNNNPRDYSGSKAVTTLFGNHCNQLHSTIIDHTIPTLHQIISRIRKKTFDKSCRTLQRWYNNNQLCNTTNSDLYYDTNHNMLSLIIPTITYNQQTQSFNVHYLAGYASAKSNNIKYNIQLVPLNHQFTFHSIQRVFQRSSHNTMIDGFSTIIQACSATLYIAYNDDNNKLQQLPCQHGSFLSNYSKAQSHTFKTFIATEQYDDDQLAIANHYGDHSCNMLFNSCHSLHQALLNNNLSFNQAQHIDNTTLNNMAINC